MEYKLRGIAEAVLSAQEGDKTSKLIRSNVRLEISPNLDRRVYLDDDDLPTKEGAKALTTALIQGLTCNIHASHQNGYWDSAAHLRFIMSELERFFVEVANVTKGTM